MPWPLRLLLLCLLPLTACVSDRAGEAHQAPTPPIVAVSNFMHPPFSSRDAAGNPAGIEVDLVAAAAAALGRDVTWLERDFGELIDAVATREVNLAASTIGVTTERAQRVRFSTPYFETSIVALVRAGEGEPASLDDLRGARVAADRGTTAVGALAAAIPDAVAVHDRDPSASWAELLAAGEVDAVVLDRSHVETFSSVLDIPLRVLAPPLATERFAFAVAPSDEAILQALNEAIAAHRTRH